MFLEIALRNAARGFRVHPLREREKAPLLKDWPALATNDRAIIEAWAAKYPNANCGVVLDDNLCVLESDDFPQFFDRLYHGPAGHQVPFPKTFTVQARANRPHIYFRQTAASRALGNCDLAGVFEFKQNRRYVVAEGSTHPAGPQYLVIDPSPIVPIPDGIIERLAALRRKTTITAAGSTDPIGEGGRHEFLTSVAGKLRNSGLTADAIEAALIPINDARCAPPIPHADIQHIAQSVGRYDVPPPEPRLVMGAPAATVAELAEDDTEDETQAARPVYPDEIWAGTAYGDFAEICTRGNNVPRKMFTEAFRTVAGALMGEQLRCGLQSVNPRSYTVLIAPPGHGKGTACDAVTRFFGDNWDSERGSNPPLLARGKSVYRSHAIGAMIANPASAPGLMNALEPDKVGKGQSPSPLDAWDPLPRILTLTEEIRGTFANFGLENTGAGLESALCELWDRDSFSSTVTAQRRQASGRLLFSLLGGITREGWDSVFSKSQSVESGFLSRVNIIATEGLWKLVGAIDTWDFAALQRTFLPRLLALQEHPLLINPTPSARDLMMEWFATLETSELAHRTRINVHAWRVALHLAWLQGSPYMDNAHVIGGIKAAEYQVKMREHYAPAEGDTRQARCQASIRRAMKSRKKMSIRELQRATNANRVGLTDWKKALAALVEARELRIDEGCPRTAILLKIRD